MAITFEQLGLTINETPSAATATAKARNEGVGDMVRHLILEGKRNKEILDIVCSHYGNNNTTYACVAWYRNNLKRG